MLSKMIWLVLVIYSIISLYQHVVGFTSNDTAWSVGLLCSDLLVACVSMYFLVGRDRITKTLHRIRNRS